MSVTEHIITLQPAGDVTAAWIRLRIKKLATAKTIDLVDVTDVDAVEIDGFVQHHGWSWQGHDIADLLKTHASDPNVQAIVPLWERWGQHSINNFTRDQKAALVDARSKGTATPQFLDTLTKTPDKGHVYGAEKLIEPLDAGVLDQVKSAFGVGDQ